MIEWIGVGLIILILWMGWQASGHYCGHCETLMELQETRERRVWVCNDCGKVEDA